MRRINEGCHIWAVNMQKTIRWEQIHPEKTLIYLSSSGHLDVVCLDVVILDKQQFLKCKQNGLYQIFLMMITFCLMNLGKGGSKWRDRKNLLLCSLNLLSQKHYNISILLGCLLLESNDIWNLIKYLFHLTGRRQLIYWFIYFLSKSFVINWRKKHSVLAFFDHTRHTVAVFKTKWTLWISEKK